MEDSSFKECPFCKEKIRKEAVKCRFCGEWLEQSTQVRTDFSQTPKPTEIILPPPLPKLVEQSPPAKEEIKTTVEVEVKKGIPLKTLYWISAALLLACGLVLFIGLAAVPWSQLSPEKQGDVSEKLSGAFTRVLICAGLLAWSVKRKGYRLLTFSIVCAVMTAISAYYFHVGKQQSEQLTQESNAKLAENVQGIFSNEVNFVKQGATDNFSNNIKPTGDAENDAILLWANNFSKAIAQYVGNMNKEITALQEQDVFDTSLLTNKSNLQVEIPKKIEIQKIIEKYKDGWLPMLEATEEQFTPVDISETVKNQILHGAETSIQRNSSQAELMFGHLLKTDQAELNFLQFMAGAYDDYQFKDGTILFGSAANSQKCEELTKSIQDATSEEETFREQYLKAAQTSIQQLGK